MPIQRLVLALVIASGFGAAPAFAQTQPLDLDQITRVSARSTAVPQPLPPTTYSSDPSDTGAPNTRLPNLFEFLFGGLRPPTPQQYQNDAVLVPESSASLGREQDADVETERPPLDPKFLPRLVAYAGPEKPGTIIIDTPNRFLYLVQEDRQAMRYGIGVGRPGFTWAGVKQVSAKREWPDWMPPDDMLRRRPDLPAFMAGGPENPLGARAIYLGSSLYRIHGSNEPWTIGQAVSSGCIRMRNEDVIALYERVKLGTKVVVI